MSSTSAPLALTPRRSDRRGIAQLGGHVLLAVGTGALVIVSGGRWWFPAALVAHGVVLCASFCAAHECVHRTAFRSRRLNDGVAAAAGLVLLLPSHWFRLFHAAHHRYTQDPGRDPELAGRTPPGRPGVVLHAAGLLYWWAMARTVAALVAGRADAPYLPPGHRHRVVRQARAYGATYAAVVAVSVAARSALALQLWILPVLVGQPFLRAFLLAEHEGCPQVPDVLASTRTTRTLGVVRRLTWNMPFHAEHHAQPQVPFHQLGALHASLAPHLGVVGRGYLRTYASLQRRRWRAAGGRVPASTRA